MIGATDLYRTKFPVATPILADDVERILANIDAGDGDCSIEFLRHSVLLVFGAPCQHLMLAGQEHGRTIPLPVISRVEIPHRGEPLT
jgi:hypothetical protein